MPKGRPSLSGQPKQEVLQIRLTAGERSRLDNAAGAVGKVTSTWARDELLRLADAASTAKKPAKKR